jgi:hypothetical protein
MMSVMSPIVPKMIGIAALREAPQIGNLQAFATFMHVRLTLQTSLLDRSARTMARTTRFGSKKCHFGGRVTIKFHLRSEVPKNPKFTPQRLFFSQIRNIE